MNTKYQTIDSFIEKSESICLQCSLFFFLLLLLLILGQESYLTSYRNRIFELVNHIQFYIATTYLL